MLSSLCSTGASVFFVNMIAVSSFGACGLELSMFVKYAVTIIMNMIQPQAMRTQRQLDTGKKPPSIDWGQRVPPIVFIFLVSIMYMPIVPIMEFFGLAYFGCMYVVWRHQCLHVYAQEFEGGGDTTWQQLFGFLIASLYMSQFVFIAYMGIKEGATQGGLGFVPLILTLWVHRFLIRSTIHPLRNLSLKAAADVDIADGELTAEDVGAGYGQPALDPELDEREPMPYRRELQEIE
jgi:hypothetical protein